MCSFLLLLFCIPYGSLLTEANDEKSFEAKSVDEKSVEADLIFYAPFDGSMNAKVFDKEASIFTADSTGRKTIEKGNSCPGVSIAKDEGVSGDCLRFASKTKKLLMYKAALAKGLAPKKDWQGTVSLWLKIDPKNLEKGYVDPIQITQNSWDDGSFFVDFDNISPRTFRLGAFADKKHWNPKNTKWKDVPEDKRPMITIKELPFAADRWTHVAFTFRDLNSTKGKNGIATLYLNGKNVGQLKRDFKYTWQSTKENPKAKIPIIMLGVGYNGDLDELKIYKRALSDSEVMKIFRATEKQ